MLTRALLASRALIKPPQMSRGMAVVKNFKPTTMNDLPVPQGSWQELHSKRQRLYNIHLIAGILAILTTIGVAKESGLVRFYFGPKIGK
ncbi:uncharacterized protein COX7B [Procambarus clarkii]|uniref:uncharacterized protein COX7B n=1 Tax=Procambarus clarkii TaxID=6728 RepID=UPI001E6756D4|nr:uncharacterized protein LOC123765428 [Procambarus clarkii]